MWTSPKRTSRIASLCAVCVFLLLCPTSFSSQNAAAAEATLSPSIVKIETSSTELAHRPNAEVELFVLVLDSKNQGITGVPPRMDVTAGMILDIKEVSAGRYRALYRMPTEKHPQAVIVAAKVPGLLPSWTVLRLRSKTELPVNTDKPNVMVTLSLHGKSYGPARTDSNGNVAIPVEVYPGDSEAQAQAVDEFGNQTHRQVSIPIPPTPSLVGFQERNVLAADGEDGSDIYLITVEPSGRPFSDASFLIHRTSGSVSPAKQLLPGLYSLRYTAPRGLDSTEAQLNLSLKDAPQSRRAFGFQLLPGRPENLTFSVEPAALVMDGKSRAKLMVSLFDLAGTPLENVLFELNCSDGTLGKTTSLGGGRTHAFLTAPKHGTSPISCEAVVKRGDKPPLRSQVSISLLAPTPESLTLAADTNRLPLDGNSSALIQIEVKDNDGDPLEGVLIRANTSFGIVSGVVEDGQGRYHTTYTAPAGKEDTRIRILFETGTEDHLLQKDIIITLFKVEPPPPPSPVLMIGANAGALTNFGRMQTATVSATGALRLPFFNDSLYVVFESGYGFGSERSSTSIEGIHLRTTLHTFPNHLALLFRLLPHSRFTPFAEIGGGTQFIQWTLQTTDGGRESNHQALWSGLASIGGEIRWGPGALTLSARILYAHLIDRGSSDAGPAFPVSSIRGNTGGTGFELGYRFFL
jgi:hypothetical protein